MKVKYLLIISLCSFLFFKGYSIYAFSQEEETGIYEDVKNYKIYNPDGQKYEFVKDCLTSLKYLHNNSERRQVAAKKIAKYAKDSIDEIHFIKEEAQMLVLDNTNLRIARNLMISYRNLKNAFILKASDSFISVANEQIDINTEGKKIYNQYYQYYAANDLSNFDKKIWLQQLNEINSQRRKSLRKLYELALLLNKILISHELNNEGEAIKLGITKEERKKLLFKLDGFYGQGFQGPLRPGQTFVQISILKVREFLEDYSWKALDE